jgi:multiple sugar transport system permease protein
MTTQLAPAAAAAIRPGSAKRRKQQLAPYLFVLPFFVVFVTMLVVPLGYAAWISLFRSRLIGGRVFVGLDNYVSALTDPGFLEGLRRVALILLVQVPIMLGLALVFALVLDSGRARGTRALRLLIFLPYAVPGVVATLMWGYLYGRDFGPIAQAFRAVGLAEPNFFSEQNMLGAIMNVITWSFVGYNMVIMYSALRVIPHELYEAAEIDGASQLRIAWSIKIPSIRPAILLTLIFSIIGSFQIFNEPKLFDALAPTVIDASYTPNYYAYNLAFVNQDVSYAATVAFLLGIVIAVVSYVVQLSSQPRERRSGA